MHKLYFVRVVDCWIQLSVFKPGTTLMHVFILLCLFSLGSFECLYIHILYSVMHNAYMVCKNQRANFLTNSNTNKLRKVTALLCMNHPCPIFQ